MEIARVLKAAQDAQNQRSIGLAQKQRRLKAERHHDSLEKESMGSTKLHGLPLQRGAPGLGKRRPVLSTNVPANRQKAVASAVLEQVPALFSPTKPVAKRFLEFFAANIRNPHTRRAYLRAVREFADWCAHNEFYEIVDVEPLHVSAYVELLGKRLAKPSVKQHLAAIRMLFDWLVVGQVVATNPAAPVRGPKYTVKKGKTPILTQEEARSLLDSIDATTVVGLRDRALIATMIYTFGRVGAVIKMRVEDYYTQGRRGWMRLHEKGGKRHEMPCNHHLEAYIDEYMAAAGIAGDAKGYLFRTTKGKTRVLTANPMGQSDLYRMIRRRSYPAGIKTRVGNHSFRATGITQYLKNGGRREIAQQMAAHESPRTTALYDRRDDEVAVDEVERVLI
jgi:site-specific recombinase XerD